MKAEWRLMQYAPKDYSQIIVYDANLDIVGAAHWADGQYDHGVEPDWYWSWHHFEGNKTASSDCSPECWMEMPERPENIR